MYPYDATWFFQLSLTSREKQQPFYYLLSDSILQVLHSLLAGGQADTRTSCSHRILPLLHSDTWTLCYRRCTRQLQKKAPLWPKEITYSTLSLPTCSRTRRNRWRVVEHGGCWSSDRKWAGLFKIWESDRKIRKEFSDFFANPWQLAGRRIRPLFALHTLRRWGCPLDIYTRRLFLCFVKARKSHTNWKKNSKLKIQIKYE